MASSSLLKEKRAALAAQPEALDEGVVPLNILVREISKLTTALADELQQPPPGGEVMLVRAKVVGQVNDAIREERYLNLGRAGVTVCPLVLLDDFVLAFSRLHTGELIPVSDATSLHPGGHSWWAALRCPDRVSVATMVTANAADNQSGDRGC